MVTESPPVSPRVVAAILMIQKVKVTSGTLLSTRSRVSLIPLPQLCSRRATQQRLDRLKLLPSRAEVRQREAFHPRELAQVQARRALLTEEREQRRFWRRGAALAA